MLEESKWNRPMFLLREGLCWAISRLSRIKRSSGDLEEEIIVKSSGEIECLVNLV